MHELEAGEILGRHTGQGVEVWPDSVENPDVVDIGVIGHDVLLCACWGLLVGPRVFRASGQAVGQGCVPVRGAARPCGLSGTFRTGGAFSADVDRRVALILSYGYRPAISHVIPL